jgi:hypothetical protein
MSENYTVLSGMNELLLITIPTSRVEDPDPHWIRIQSGLQIRIRILGQETEEIFQICTGIYLNDTGTEFFRIEENLCCLNSFIFQQIPVPIRYRYLT